MISVLQNLKTGEMFNQILRKLDYFIGVQVSSALIFMEIVRKLLLKSNIFCSIPHLLKINYFWDLVLFGIRVARNDS